MYYYKVILYLIIGETNILQAFMGPETGKHWINWGTGCLENTFASFSNQIICDIFYAVFAIRNTRPFSKLFAQVLIQWHILSFHNSLSDELKITFVSLIVGVSHFHIFEETSLDKISLRFNTMFQNVSNPTSQPSFP